MMKRKIADYEQQLRTTKELDERAGEGTVCDHLGNGYFIRMGDLRQAAEYQKQCLNSEKELGDKDQEGRAYCKLGALFEGLGDFIQALEYHKYGLSNIKELMQSDGVKCAQGKLVNAFQRIGDLKQAMEHHKHRLCIVKELDERAVERAACGNIGNDYQRLGDLKQTTKYHRKALIIAKELGKWAGEGVACGSLGNAYQSLHQFKQVIEYFKKRRSIVEELGQRDEEVAVHGNIGIAYRRLGKFKQAIKYHEDFFRIFKELDLLILQRAACGNLGNDYLCLGNFKQAIEYFKLDLSIAQDLGERAGEGSAYGNLGNVYHELGDFEEAIECFKKFLDIAKELGKRDEQGCAYGKLGNTYRSLGDFKKALEYQVKHLNIAKELGQRQAEGSAYSNLGNVYHGLGDFNQAIVHQMKALCIAEELGHKDNKADVCYSLGCIFESVGALHEALDYYRSSVKICNDLRALVQSEDVLKITFRNACQYAFTALWRTLVSLQKIEEALYVAEQGRAQALSDLMKLQYYSESPESIEAKETVPNLSAGLSTQCPTVFMALESNTINLWIINGTKTYFQKKTIEDATLLIQKAFKEIGVGVHVKCENRSLDGPDRNETLTDGSCQEIIDYENSSLRLLFNSIITPIENKIEGDELIIVPDGPLCLAPYAAFVNEASRYLSESIRIRVIPSLTSLKLITETSQSYHNTTGALLVGDPCLEEVKRKRGNHNKFGCLPWAREEVKMIGEILKTEPLTGRGATKDEVLRRMSSVAVIHIAAHGDMKAGEIILAPNPTRTSKIPAEKDYMLKMSDVQGVQLRARLVVLSCCHSAQGRVTPEGVIGIARAFLGAGARSVLVSLWAIDDEATMEFMKSFYTHLGGRNSASVSLNQAMKCLRESEKFSAVKYWAPFVLIGDDVTIEFGEK